MFFNFLDKIHNDKLYASLNKYYIIEVVTLFMYLNTILDEDQYHKDTIQRQLQNNKIKLYKLHIGLR